MAYPKSLKIWLFIGLIMVFIQIIVGGITRLTESGLSITKWEVVTGTLPPIGEESWLEEFSKYKETPQYKEINEGMSLSDFKFIYFWEYIHRLWARLMGFVFLIPFCWFYYKGKIDKALLAKLGVVIFFAVLAAIFGWIMVASGLIERPWVNAYKLSIHLLIAVCVFVSLEWTLLSTLNLSNDLSDNSIKVSNWFLMLGLINFQLIIGGILSGMKAAVIYPTWPDMNGVYLPDILLDTKEWRWSNFYEYDKNLFMPALIHFIHRNTAYIITIFGMIISYDLRKYWVNSKYIHLKVLPYIFVLFIFIQILFGIVTVLSSKGKVPVMWGVLHQGGAILVISVVVLIIFYLRLKK